MNFNIADFSDILAGVGDDATMKDMFNLTDGRLQAIKARRQLGEAKRATVAAAAARVFATPDGRMLLEAMLDMTFRRHVHVAGLGLSSDVAMQAMIDDNAQKEFVWQLVKLAREGMGETPAT